MVCDILGRGGFWAIFGSFLGFLGFSGNPLGAEPGRAGTEFWGRREAEFPYFRGRGSGFLRPNFEVFLIFSFSLII